MPFNFVIDLLKKPRADRSPSENEFICEWLIQNFQIFSKINKETVDDIVNNSNLAECESNSIIIKQGDLGSSFFLIVGGKVSIYINTDSVEEPSVSAKTSKENPNKEQIGLFNKVTDKSKYGNFVGFIEAGSGFGEMALISDDVRNATIISEDNCLLLILDKEVYNRSLRLFQETEFKAFTSFVNASPIFHNWAPKYKKQVAMSLRRQIFPYDRVVIKQGEKINGIGFIIEGQAKVVVDVTMHCQQYPFLGLSDQLLVDEISNFKSQGLAKSLDKVKNVKHLEISLVGPGEIIGDIEHAKGLDTSYKTVMPIEPTEIYFLNEKNYERLIISKRNQTTSDMLRKWADQKLLSQYIRPTYKQLPLIYYLVQQILQERIKAKEQNLEMQTKKLSVVKSSDFITRGPLIDMYGPGTVFYRNRLLRQKKDKSRKTVPLSQSESIDVKHDKQVLYHNAKLECDPTFLDWETSTNKLDKLETKILSWYETESNANQKINVPRLQRFIKKENEIVKPGKTILLKPRKFHKLSDGTQEYNGNDVRETNIEIDPITDNNI